MSDAEREFAALHEAYLAKYKPLAIKSEKAWWTASITGSDEAFEARKQAENALVELHSDKETFARLKSFKESSQVKDPVLHRVLEVMYNEFLPGQADVELQKRIVALEADVELVNERASKIWIDGGAGRAEAADIGHGPRQARG